MNEAVLYEMNGGIATITLNRPEQLNSMSPDLLGGALTALEEASSNDAVRIVVLTGAGRAFCAGGDLGGMAEGNPGGLSGDGSTQTLIHQLRHAMMTSQLLHDMPKVTIAAINGPCAGAGLAWACACDIRICSERAVFNTAFATAGLSGDFGGTWTLSRIVGPAKARELYLLAEKFDSFEAQRIGLVARRVPDERLMEEVFTVAQRLLSFAPLTLPSIKANLNDATMMSLAQLMDVEADRHIRMGLTQDAQEAAAAFLEKRPASFYGK